MNFTLLFVADTQNLASPHPSDNVVQKFPQQVKACVETMDGHFEHSQNAVV